MKIIIMMISISKLRINHAILTGLSIIMMDKTNTIMSMGMYFDECDIPIINESSMQYKSNTIKIRELLVNNIETNDHWIMLCNSNT